MRPIRRRVKQAALSVLSILIALSTSFAVIEVWPSLLCLVPLDRLLPYYAIKKHYVSDPVLVFINRDLCHSASWVHFSKGDLYSPNYGVEAQAIPFAFSYVEGFQRNLSAPPWPITVVGDSYLEIGESDNDTFAEHLAKVSAMGVRNLGRAFYGPHQYIEVLKRSGQPDLGRFVIFAFFDGNDIEDIRQYQRWRHDGQYHFYYDVSRLSAPGRLRVILTEGVRAFRRASSGAYDDHGLRRDRADLGMIALRGSVVPMAFAYWNWQSSAEELLHLQEWRTLGGLLGEFKRLTLGHSAIPVVLYIPTKLQVYGRLATSASGTRFLTALHRQLQVERNSSIALEHLARTAGIAFVNLLPSFQALAQEGELLYHPFDTHWNSRGRRTAAELVFESLMAIPLEGLASRESTR